jgi:arsenate reductase
VVLPYNYRFDRPGSLRIPSVKKSQSSCTIYHNPRCSKSRATVALVQAQGVEPKIVEYLRESPTAQQIKALLTKLGMSAAELVRKNEDVYKQKFSDRTPTEAQLIAAMVEHPVLIERPIVVVGERAALGRPPENVLQLLK